MNLCRYVQDTKRMKTKTGSPVVGKDSDVDTGRSTVGVKLSHQGHTVRNGRRVTSYICTQHRGRLASDLTGVRAARRGCGGRKPTAQTPRRNAIVESLQGLHRDKSVSSFSGPQTSRKPSSKNLRKLVQ